MRDYWDNDRLLRQKTFSGNKFESFKICEFFIIISSKDVEIKLLQN